MNLINTNNNSYENYNNNYHNIFTKIVKINNAYFTYYQDNFLKIILSTYINGQCYLYKFVFIQSINSYFDISEDYRHLILIYK